MNKKNFDLVMFFLISLGFISTTTVEAGRQHPQGRTFQPRRKNPQNRGRIRVNTNTFANEHVLLRDSQQINYLHSTRVENFQKAVHEKNNEIRTLKREDKSLKRRITTIFDSNDIPALEIAYFPQMWKNMKPYQKQNLARRLVISCTEIRETLELKTNKKG